LLGSGFVVFCVILYSGAGRAAASRKLRAGKTDTSVLAICREHPAPSDMLPCVNTDQKIVLGKSAENYTLKVGGRHYLGNREIGGLTAGMAPDKTQFY
jgi:hypothetical protein